MREKLEGARETLESLVDKARPVARWTVEHSVSAYKGFNKWSKKVRPKVNKYVVPVGTFSLLTSAAIDLQQKVSHLAEPYSDQLGETAYKILDGAATVASVPALGAGLAVAAGSTVAVKRYFGGRTKSRRRRRKPKTGREKVQRVIENLVVNKYTLPALTLGATVQFGWSNWKDKLGSEAFTLTEQAGVVVQTGLAGVIGVVSATALYKYFNRSNRNVNTDRVGSHSGTKIVATTMLAANLLSAPGIAPLSNLAYEHTLKPTVTSVSEWREGLGERLASIPDRILEPEVARPDDDSLVSDRYVRRRVRYQEHIDRYSQESTAPRDLIQAVLRTESNYTHFNPDGTVITSPDGAKGVGQHMRVNIMQLNFATGKPEDRVRVGTRGGKPVIHGVEEGTWSWSKVKLDPEYNVKATAATFDYLFERLGCRPRDVPHEEMTQEEIFCSLNASAAYNGGINRTLRAIEREGSTDFWEWRDQISSRAALKEMTYYVKMIDGYMMLFNFDWPTESRRITSPFGWRVHPTTGKRHLHGGLDVGGATPRVKGDPILAPYDGVVVHAGTSSAVPANGTYVVLRHGVEETDLQSYYLHLDEAHVRTGQRVERGAVIGEMGTTGRSTGVHLDFRFKRSGHWIDPLSTYDLANGIEFTRGVGMAQVEPSNQEEASQELLLEREPWHTRLAAWATDVFEEHIRPVIFGETEEEQTNRAYFAGNTLRNEGRLDEAIATYQELITAFPEASIVDDAYDKMGDAYRTLGDLEKALEAYQSGVGAGNGDMSQVLTQKIEEIQETIELQAQYDAGLVATYTIQRGDTLFDLARATGTTSAELKRINDITDPRSLRPGQTIKIPNLAVYKIGHGLQDPETGEYQAVPEITSDTVYSIARAFGMEERMLRELNGISTRVIRGKIVPIIKPEQELYVVRGQ